MSNNNSPYQGSRFLLILILGLLSALGPISIDLYLPAFSEIASRLNTSTDQVALSLSSFFVGLAIGQLIYGPILERYGRKYPIYAGLGIYIIASLCCASANSIHALIVFRFFQALGSCASLVAARTIVRDLFDTREVARIFSMLIMVIAVSPLIAPSLGGYITVLFGWEFVFLALTFLAILLLIGTIFILPQSRQPNKEYSLKLNSIFQNYMKIMREKQFYIFAFVGAIAYSGIYAYISGSPNLYMEIFNLSEQHYGWIFGIIALGLIIASQLNAIVLKKYSTSTVLPLALKCQCIVALLLCLSVYLDYTGVYLTTVLIWSYLFCLGFIFSNASALSLKYLGHTAGNASALMGAIQMAVGAIASAMVSVFENKSMLSMVWVMACCAFFGTALYFSARSKVDPE